MAGQTAAGPLHSSVHTCAHDHMQRLRGHLSSSQLGTGHFTCATFHHFLVHIHNDPPPDLLPSLIFILLMEKNINYEAMINTAFCELCFLQCFPSSCKFYAFLFSPLLLLLPLSFNSGPLSAGVLLSLSGWHFQGSCNGWAAQGYIQVSKNQTP